VKISFVKTQFLPLSSCKESLDELLSTKDESIFCDERVVVFSLGGTKSSDESLAAAEESERALRWQEASAHYRQALSKVTKDSLKNRIRARLGHSLLQVAMKAPSPYEFRNGIRSAIEACEEEHLGDSPTRTVDSSAFRCHALVAYLKSWLTTNPRKKRQFLDHAWSLTKQSLDGYQKAQDVDGFIDTHNQLGITAQRAFAFEWSL
jgi:hypothetical protein